MGTERPLCDTPKRSLRQHVLGLNYISPAGREACKTFQYAGEDWSLLYRYALSPLAQYLVNNHTPRWLAPNAITFAGLCLVMLSWLSLAFYCPEMHCPADMPSWPWFLAAICMFAYQTLDNMDGKQARRTGSSSPLGLLFDHGCDAVNSCVFSTINLAIALQAGLSPYNCMLLFTALAGLFYIATWEEFHLHKMVLPIVNGPSDGIVLLCIGYLYNGFFGQGWLSASFFGYSGSVFLCTLTCAAATLTTVASVAKVCWTLVKRDQGFVRPLFRISPLVLVMVCGWHWVLRSRLFPKYPMLFIMVFGMHLTDAVTKLMISHVCSQRFRPNWVVLVMFASSVLGLSYMDWIGTPVSEAIELRVLKLNWILVHFSTWSFVAYAMNQLASSLGIRVFRIPSKDE